MSTTEVLPTIQTDPDQILYQLLVSSPKFDIHIWEGCAVSEEMVHRIQDPNGRICDVAIISHLRLLEANPSFSSQNGFRYKVFDRLLSDRLQHANNKFPLKPSGPGKKGQPSNVLWVPEVG